MGRAIPLSRWLVIAGGLVLAASAVFHATGYSSVSSAMQASGAQASLVAVVRALWIMFSAHLLILSVIVILASGVPRARRVVLACALIPAFDTFLLLRFVGLFVGTFALAGATVLLICGGLLEKRRESFDAAA